MEGLLILVGIYVLEIVIKKITANRKKKFEEQAEIPEDEQDYADSSEAAPARKPRRNLQELIREFEEAQRNASQGTMEPATPPMDESSEDDYREGEENESDELPVITPKNPGTFTFEEIAESVVQWEVVSVDLLVQAFNFSEHTAAQVLAELQGHKIVGRDMGDGFCDLLIHDQVELSNLFKREQREQEEQKQKQLHEEALREREATEAKHQKELAELEERARQAREQAGQSADSSLAISDSSESNGAIRSRSFDKNEIRRGFIWAKVLDEPRFKRRWSPNYR